MAQRLVGLGVDDVDRGHARKRGSTAGPLDVARHRVRRALHECFHRAIVAIAHPPRDLVDECRLHGRVAIIGAGGIASAEDAYTIFRAGANLVELYTAMIYEGPGIAASIKSGLARLMARDGFRAIDEAVGKSSGI